MYVLTLNPGESAFVRCTHCQNLNLMVTNEKETEVSLQFKAKDDHLDAKCDRCKRHYFWTPISVAIVKPTHDSN
jgi:phage FluMu protein Com